MRRAFATHRYIEYPCKGLVRGGQTKLQFRKALYTNRQEKDLMSMNEAKKMGFRDYEIKKMDIDYGCIRIQIEGATEYTIICKDYIGMEYIGQWDECVIEEIEVCHEDEIINRSLDVISKYNSTDILGGGSKKFDSQWICLKVKLIDSVVINIACADVDIIEM